MTSTIKGEGDINVHLLGKVECIGDVVIEVEEITNLVFNVDGDVIIKVKHLPSLIKGGEYQLIKTSE